MLQHTPHRPNSVKSTMQSDGSTILGCQSGTSSSSCELFPPCSLAGAHPHLAAKDELRPHEPGHQDVCGHAQVHGGGWGTCGACRGHRDCAEAAAPGLEAPRAQGRAVHAAAEADQGQPQCQLPHQGLGAVPAYSRNHATQQGGRVTQVRARLSACRRARKRKHACICAPPALSHTHTHTHTLNVRALFTHTSHHVLK